jgi:hypothetical protein
MATQLSSASYAYDSRFGLLDSFGVFIPVNFPDIPCHGQLSFHASQVRSRILDGFSRFGAILGLGIADFSVFSLY